MMDKKSPGERDICTKFITPSFVRSGWDLKNQIREEMTFTLIQPERSVLQVRDEWRLRFDSSVNAVTPAPLGTWQFTDGRIHVRVRKVARGKRKRDDYILFQKPNIPIAVIKVKDNNHSVGDGMQQTPDVPVHAVLSTLPGNCADSVHTIDFPHISMPVRRSIRHIELRGSIDDNQKYGLFSGEGHYGS